MTSGERITGVRDKHYNLMSVLYHALQGVETYQQYINDAHRAGDRDLAHFFRDVQEEERQRAQELLKQRMASGTRSM